MISALFVRKDSVYKELGIDCYDIDRDGRNFSGTHPIICHPPCRAWGRLKHFAKPRPDEKELALFCIEKIRKYGGVLEHPAGSTLFKLLWLPKPGCFDPYGGYTIQVDQFNFGHKARKRTLLYIVGLDPNELPKIPVAIGEPEFVVSSSKYKYGDEGYRKRITDKERESTPLEFAKFLIQIAEKINK